MPTDLDTRVARQAPIPVVYTLARVTAPTLIPQPADLKPKKELVAVVGVVTTTVEDTLELEEVVGMAQVGKQANKIQERVVDLEEQLMVVTSRNYCFWELEVAADLRTITATKEGVGQEEVSSPFGPKRLSSKARSRPVEIRGHTPNPAPETVVVLVQGDRFTSLEAPVPRVVDL